MILSSTRNGVIHGFNAVAELKREQRLDWAVVTGVIHGGNAVAELKLPSLRRCFVPAPPSSTAATPWPN